MKSGLWFAVWLGIVCFFVGLFGYYTWGLLGMHYSNIDAWEHAFEVASIATVTYVVCLGMAYIANSR